MLPQPTLLNSCANAATAAEARYRIDGPEPAARATRVIALDEGAADIALHIWSDPWRGARFFTYESSAPGTDPTGDGLPDATLRAADGTTTQLHSQLADADVAVMIATSDTSSEAVALVGRACADRGVMTAGLVIQEGHGADGAVKVLRPFATVLLVSRDEDDVRELLTALRA